MRVLELEVGNCFKFEKKTGLILFGSPIMEVSYFIILSKNEIMVEIQKGNGHDKNCTYTVLFPYEDVKQISQGEFLQAEEGVF